MSYATKAWKAANAEKVKEQKAKWYLKHREKILAKDKERARPITDRKRDQNAAWKRANRDACRMHDQNRKSRKSDGGSLSAGLASRLFKLQNGKCPCCKRPLGDDYHMDHIMPLYLGGQNTDVNIQLLRAECNLKKNSKHPIEFMQSKGFLL